MLFRLHQRCLRFRTMWCALLAVALIWQPALLVAGAVHEGEHTLQGAHAHAAQAGEHHHDHADPHPHEAAAESDGGDGLHRLLHLAHCCVHATATAAEATLLSLAPADAAPVGPTTDADPGPRLTRPLRPPIRG